MWFLIGVQLFIIGLFLFLGWSITVKKAYWLISNFASRSKLDQEQLIRNGFPQKTGVLLIVTALGMLLLLPFNFTDFKYAMELQFGFMIVFLLGGFIYLSKYELPQKRKFNYTFSSVLFVVVIGLISVLSYHGYEKSNLVLKKDTFEITGMYGRDWDYEDIEKVELLEQMSKVTWKQNGFGTTSVSKGHFKVTGYGSCLLFIQKGYSPYLYIQMDGKDVFINSEDATKTVRWYEALKNKQ